MQVVNRLIPIRDRAVVQLNLNRLNAIFEGDPLNQLDVLSSDGGSGYTLAPHAAQLVTDRVTELQGHEVGRSSSGASIAPTVRLAIQYFKLAMPLVTRRPVPSVEDLELTPEDAVVEPVTAEPKPRLIKKPKTKHRI